MRVINDLKNFFPTVKIDVENLKAIKAVILERGFK